MCVWVCVCVCARVPFLKSLLNLLQYCFCLWFGYFDSKACVILAPRPEIKPAPHALEAKVSTTGSSRKPPEGHDSEATEPGLKVEWSLAKILNQGQRGPPRYIGGWRQGRLPRYCSGKESTCQCRRHKRHRFNPWVKKIPWSRKWQPAPVFLPGKFHGWRSLAGYSPWGCKELDTTEHTHTQTHKAPAAVFSATDSSLPARSQFLPQ